RPGGRARGGPRLGGAGRRLPPARPGGGGGGIVKLPAFVRTQRRKVWIGLACVVMSAAFAIWVRANGEALPTADVKQGEWIDNVELRGEVKALRSISLSAPSNAGELQILKLV